VKLWLDPSVAKLFFVRRRIWVKCHATQLKGISVEGFLLLLLIRADSAAMVEELLITFDLVFSWKPLFMLLDKHRYKKPTLLIINSVENLIEPRKTPVLFLPLVQWSPAEIVIFLIAIRERPKRKLMREKPLRQSQATFKLNGV
jgi:hypothetical protein